MIPANTFTPQTVPNLLFRTQAGQVVDLTNPLARAIICLESPHSTPADVLLFVAAALLMYEEVFTSIKNDANAQLDGTKPPLDAIASILTRRFRELIESKNGHDAYYAALFLHPGMSILVHFPGCVAIYYLSPFQ